MTEHIDRKLDLGDIRFTASRTYALTHTARAHTAGSTRFSYRCDKHVGESFYGYISKSLSRFFSMLLQKHYQTAQNTIATTPPDASCKLCNNSNHTGSLCARRYRKILFCVIICIRLCHIKFDACQSVP